MAQQQKRESILTKYIKEKASLCPSKDEASDWNWKAIYRIFV